MGKKKGAHGGHSNHPSQDVQEESKHHDPHHQKAGNQVPVKRRQSRESEMRSKVAASSMAGSESLFQSRDSKNAKEESTGFNGLSLPSKSNSSTHGSRSSDLNYKTKNPTESHDRHKQQTEAAENSSSKHENASSAIETSNDSARHDRETTPLATNTNPKIIVPESDGEISSGHSTPVAKPGYHGSCELEISMSPAGSNSTLTTVGIHSPPECNGYGDVNDQHYHRHVEMDGGMPLDYRDKYYNHSKQHSLQLPHDQKFKKRGSGEFQSLKELDEGSFRAPGDHHRYSFNTHEFSYDENFSSLPRSGAGKKRTSLGDIYGGQESPPSSPRFLSQSVMDINEQDEALSQGSEKSNLSRMSSEPYLGPTGLQYGVYDTPKYQHPPNNYRYSSGNTYSHFISYSGGRQGNPTRNRYIKHRERVPARRHSGENSNHLAVGDRSNSTSSLSQPRRG